MPETASITHDRPPAPRRRSVDPSTVRVAFQGELGAFGDAAIRSHWGSAASPVPARSFDEVVALVATGAVESAVLPVWNSTIGPIAPALAALAALERAPAPLTSVGEIDLPVRHALLALPGASLDELRAVGSHPAALGQCARWLAARPRITACRAYDTAGAARELSRLGSGAPDESGALPWYAGLTSVAPTQLAAIASAAAAAPYGLVVLADAVQDDPTNLTRFRIVERRSDGDAPVG